jgi:hypothetical protein
MKTSNQIRGKKAKAVGRTFEELFEINCLHHGIGFKKIHDGCHRAYINGKLRLIPRKQPFDYFIFRNRLVASIDTKTVQGNTFTYTQCDQKQLEHLRDVAEQGIPSGLVIWFREVDCVVFFDVYQVLNLKSRSSLSYRDGLYLGKPTEFNIELILKWHLL